MNIIAVAGLDATNYEFVIVLEEMAKRGYNITVFAKSTENINIQMLSKFSSNIREIDQLEAYVRTKEFTEVDFIFCANDTMRHFLEVRKYIFSWSITSIFGTYLSEGGDFMFTTGKLCYKGNYKEINATMPVGSPKFRRIEEKKKCDKKKTFLFIDSGHYPFGEEGKRILASIILKICKTYPDYKMIVKPRFLEEDIGVTHFNSNHLYKSIRELTNDSIPNNLILLKSHGDMNELIAKSDTVICMYTSAFLDVLVQDKGLIIIGNLPNEDAYDMRNNWHWAIAEEECKKSGCFVDYRAVLSELPDGKHPHEGYLDNKVARIGNSANVIVDTMEYIYGNILVEGFFPMIREYECMEPIRADRSVTWEKLIENRKLNYLMYSVSRYIDTVNNNVDMLLFENWIDSKIEKKLLFSTAVNVLLGEKQKIIEEIIIENEDLLGENLISEAAFLEIATKRNPDKVLKYLDLEEAEGRARDYYKAEVYLQKGQYREAINYYKKYLMKSAEISFYKYRCDRNRYQIFPFDLVREGEKVAIYGTEKLGRQFGTILRTTKYALLQCFIDEKKGALEIEGVPAISTNRLQEYNLDAIVIAIEDVHHNKKVFDELSKMTWFKGRIISSYYYLRGKSE